jgi:predicted GNAT family acetyltransferase
VPDDVQVVDVPEAGRYELRVGGEPVGFVSYRRRDERIVFLHTEVDPSVGGRGLGGRLAAAVLDDARRQGLSVVPLCPFIAGYIDKHPDYEELVA